MSDLEKLQRKLRMIQEGIILESDDDDEDEELDLDDDDLDIEDLDDLELDEDLLAEVNLAIIESEVGSEQMPSFLAEHAHVFVRDQLLTEDVVGKSYIVLSPKARRQRAINLLKLRMARKAADPRYRKLVIARKFVKRMLGKIRGDSRYKKAETIVRRQRFKIINNPAAVAAFKKAQTMKLQ